MVPHTNSFAIMCLMRIRFFEREIVTASFHTTPDQLRYSQFGGGLGGPIRKNRTFFFSNIEFTRERTSSQVTGIDPTTQSSGGLSSRRLEAEQAPDTEPRLTLRISAALARQRYAPEPAWHARPKPCEPGAGRALPARWQSRVPVLR